MMDDRHLATWLKSRAKQDWRMTTDIMLDHNGIGGDQCSSQTYAVTYRFSEN